MPARNAVYYSVRIGLQVCEHVRDGLSMEQISSIPGMPNWTTIGDWRGRHPEFAEAYAAARHASAESLEHEAMRVARAATTRDEAACARVRFNVLSWAAAKRNPKGYGERTMVEHAGGVDVRAMTDADLRCGIASLAGTLGIALNAGGVGEAASDAPAVDLLPGHRAAET